MLVDMGRQWMAPSSLFAVSLINYAKKKIGIVSADFQKPEAH